MKRHYVKDFFHSFYSIISYKEFSKQGNWRTARFILLTSFILTLIFSSIVYVKMSHYATSISEDFLQEMKDFTFKNGTFTVEEEAFDHMPLIYPFGKKESMIVVDTRDKYDDMMLKNNKNIVYIAKKKTMIKVKGSSVLELPYQDFKDYSFTKSDVAHFIKKAPKVVTAFSLLSFFVIVISYYIYALITSLFAMIINRIFETNLDYKALFNLSVYALTPMFFIEHLIILPFNLGTYLLFPVSCVYLVLAIKKHKNL